MLHFMFSGISCDKKRFKVRLPVMRLGNVQPLGAGISDEADEELEEHIISPRGFLRTTSEKKTLCHYDYSMSHIFEPCELEVAR